MNLARRAAEYIIRLRPPMHQRKVPMHMRGDIVSRQLFKAVKAAIAENQIRQLYDNEDIAEHFNIGKSTFFRIKKARNYREYRQKLGTNKRKGIY